MPRSFKERLLQLRNTALQDESNKQLAKDTEKAKELLAKFETYAESQAKRGNCEASVYSFERHEFDAASSAIKGITVVDSSKMPNVPRLMYRALLAAGLSVYVKYTEAYDADDYPSLTMYAAWADK